MWTIVKAVLGHCGGVVIVACAFWLAEHAVLLLYPSSALGSWIDLIDVCLVFIIVTGLAVILLSDFIPFVVQRVVSAWKGVGRDSTQCIFA